MVNTLLNFWISFLAGLFAPLGAVCVLPLYPGFLSYLATQASAKGSEKETKKKIIMFGWLITLGVILSMFIIGLIFSFFLKASLTNAIGIISPIAFGILALISLLLIFNIDLGAIIPKAKTPALKNPYWSSLIFGLFFGAIVLPCNPASLAVLFAVSLTVTDFIINLFNFLFFGLGMALPLLVLAYISSVKTTGIIKFLTTYKKQVNFVAGLIMLAISLYYLIFVFRIFG